MSGWVRELSSDGQLRWIGPEKGVIHLATAAIVNAFWDLWAKMEAKPVWKLLVDMTPEQIVSLVDFRSVATLRPILNFAPTGKL
jgi:L-fuconate dehydratase